MTRVQVFLAATALTAVPLSGTHADPKEVVLVPGVTTHIGQGAFEHVMLHSFYGSGGCPIGEEDTVKFVRYGPDARPVTGGEFRVPKGKLFIVTDVNFTFINAAVTNRRVNFEFEVQDVICGVGCEQDLFRTSFETDSVGRGGESISFTTGLVIGPTARICPETNTAEGLGNINIYGYLVPTRRAKKR